MTAVAMEIIEKFARLPQVNDAADAAIRECFQQRRAAAQKLTPAQAECSGWMLAFNRLGHWAQTPREEEDQWEPRPEMTPRKIQRGQQSSHMAGSDLPRSKSQKRWSQSRPWEECDPKKGHTEDDGRPNRVQVGIDWSNTGIQKPAPKLDSRHPSFKPDSSKGGNEQQPQMKSVVLKDPLKQSSSHSVLPRFRELLAGSGEKATSKNSRSNEPEKIELKEKPYKYIAEHIHRLDPQGYMEEIQFFRHFHRNLKDFALEIIVITDWGRKYHSVGLQFSIPPFPHYLFDNFAGSRQAGGQVPTKPDYLFKPGGDVRGKCSEVWIWMVTILQFWTDKASITDGELFGGRSRSVSALAEYVKTTINPVLPPGYKVTWDHVIARTPWLKKRLFGLTTDEERRMRHQPIPVAGISSVLEVAMERCYNEHIMDMAAQQKKREQQGRLGPKSTLSSKPTTKTLGRGQTLKLHLKKAAPGKGWATIPPKDDGPNISRVRTWVRLAIPHSLMSSLRRGRT